MRQFLRLGKPTHRLISDLPASCLNDISYLIDLCTEEELYLPKITGELLPQGNQ